MPVLNGGDGTNEHPSQALLDLYTVRRELAGRGRGVDGLRIAVIGDLKYGRAAHSLLKLLALFNDVRAHLVSPPGLEAPAAIIDALSRRGHQLRVFHSLADGIEHTDILYVTRTQEERFANQEEADRYRGLFRIKPSEFYTEHLRTEHGDHAPVAARFRAPKPKSWTTTSSPIRTSPSSARPTTAWWCAWRSSPWCSTWRSKSTNTPSR